MKRRGFTLVELLAVIIVIAIIALIATPIITNIIEQNRVESAELSMSHIKDTAKLYYVNNQLTGTLGKKVFVCEDGACTNGEETLKIDGQVPESGSIIIDELGNVSFNLIFIDGYLCTEHEEKFTCAKSERKNNSSQDGVIVLNDFRESGLVNLKINGNSVQQTYTGNNLFNPEAEASLSHSKSYFGYKLDINKSYTLRITLKEGKTVPSGVYFGLAYYKTGNTAASAEWGLVNGQLSKNIASVKVSDTIDYLYLAAYPGNKQSWDAVIDAFEISLYEGEYTALTIPAYEPYVGGVATPNPNYPQKIESMGNLITDQSNSNYGKYEIPVKVTGKNLFDYSMKYHTKVYDTANSTLIEEFDNGVIIQGNDGTGTGNAAYSNGWYRPGNHEFVANKRGLELKQGDIVTVSADYTILESYPQNNGLIGLHLYGTKNIVKNITMPELNVKTRINMTFTIATDGYYYPVFSLNSNKVKIENIQIEKNSIATEYEEYKERKYSIYLDEPLRKVGDYADYIDFEKGQVIRNIYRKVVNGTEPIVYDSGALSFTGINPSAISNENILLCKSNYYNSSDWSSLYDKGYTTSSTGTQGIALNGTYIRIVDMINFPNVDSDATQANKFKTYVAEQYANGTPLIIDYVLATPSPEPIDLPDIRLFEGYNEITIDTEIKPSVVAIDYQS